MRRRRSFICIASWETGGRPLLLAYQEEPTMKSKTTGIPTLEKGFSGWELIRLLIILGLIFLIFPQS
uniref:Uncharacterized protein n=1 Tax=Rhizophora mucronata TaxID=61149 RepID=A0A2P2QBU6_RHIMU